MSIGSEADLEGMKRTSEVVKEALAVIEAALEPGVTTMELNQLCGEVFARYGALSAPLITYGAPVNAFFSVNDAVVHGLPTRRTLRAGDVLKVDVTPALDGYIADAARTFVIPPVSATAKRLINCAEAAFWAAMRVARVGRPIRAVGRAVEKKVKAYGFSVIQDLAGHGVGRAIHEAPDIPNFYHSALRQPFTEHLVVAIEPMVAAGRGEVEMRPDRWTIATQDGSLSAHYENTVIIQRGKPLVLTA